MAMADYYQCDVCGGKCYYDANLNWEIDDDTGVWSLDHMGAMAAICERCAKTHEVVVQDKGGREAEQPAVPESKSMREGYSASYVMGWNSCRECVLEANTQPPAEQPAVPEGWVHYSNHVPSETDADCNGEVWAYNTVKARVECVSWYSVASYYDGIFEWWKPTGLKRPELPQGGRE